MPYLLNQLALERAKSLIRAGKFNADPWTFSVEDSNALLGQPGDQNWTEFKFWFLGSDSTLPKESKDAYSYPYGKANGVSVAALTEIVQKAAADGYGDVSRAAQECLDMVKAMQDNAGDTDGKDDDEDDTAGDVQQAQRELEVANIAGKAKSFSLSGRVDIKAAAFAGGSPSFTMIAYTGGAMNLEGLKFPVVIDLTGMEGLDKSRPILRDHDLARVIGHADNIKVVGADTLVCSGVISGHGPQVDEVITASRNGFPWEASVGANTLEMEFIKAGQTGSANGKTFEGPICIARRTALREISFVALGADDQTSARIAAIAARNVDMDFNAWLKAKGFDPDKISDDQRTYLKASYESEAAAIKAKADADLKAKAAKDADKASGTGNADDSVKMLRAESARISRVTLLTAKHPEIQAKAIDEGWDEEKTKTQVELVELRAGRSGRAAPPMINTGAGFTPEMHFAAIQAGAYLAAGIREDFALKGLDPKVANLATSREYRGTSLHRIMAQVAMHRGQHVSPGVLSESEMLAILQHPAEREIRAADGGTFTGGFSTMTVTGITENIANKALLAGYGSITSVVDKFTYQTDTNDFKVFKRYRMTASGRMQEVGTGGEIKSVGAQDETYPNQVKTYGGIITVTRNNLINDDMSAFTDLATLLGRQGALQRERLVFTALLGATGVVAPGASPGQTANAFNFYSSGAKNYLSGGTSPLAIASLTAAVQLLREQKDANGDPIMVNPGQLLVGPALEATADNLFSGANLTVQAITLPAQSSGTSDAQAASQVPNINTHKGKYMPFQSPYVGAQGGLTGGSDTAWWLLPSPGDCAAGFAPIQIGYLRGQRVPMIERGEMPMTTLGIGLRAIYDFGIALHDYRVSVMSAGA